VSCTSPYDLLDLLRWTWLATLMSILCTLDILLRILTRVRIDGDITAIMLSHPSYILQLYDRVTDEILFNALTASETSRHSRPTTAYFLLFS